MSCCMQFLWVFLLSMLHTSCVITIVNPTTPKKNASSVHAPKFMAAVYEHRAFFSANASADEVVRTNVDIFIQNNARAASQNAQIIVFPEYGTTSLAPFPDFMPNRSDVLPYFLEVPDYEFNACDTTNTWLHSSIRGLACTAKKFGLYNVVNIAEVVWCDGRSTIPYRKLTPVMRQHCPSDGRYQFNTNVVLNPNGIMVAKYRKQNLFYEPYLDVPSTEADTIIKPKPDECTIEDHTSLTKTNDESRRLLNSTFSTPFGCIGVITCFDLAFFDPLITNILYHNVTTVVMPSAWFNKLPFLSLIEAAQAVAMRLQINLLTANLHVPEAAFLGSGVFSPHGAVAFSYAWNDTDNGQLAVGQLPILTNHLAKSNLNVHSDCDAPRQIMKVKAAGNADPGASFYGDVAGDRFKMVPIKPHTTADSTPVLSSVCYNADAIVCCESVVQFDNSTAHDETLVLAVFSGRHTVNYTMPVDVCSLLKCGTPGDLSTCGAELGASNVTLSYVKLSGNFTRTSYVYPEMISGENANRNASSPLFLESTQNWTFKTHIPPSADYSSSSACRAFDPLIGPDNTAVDTVYRFEIESKRPIVGFLYTSLFGRVYADIVDAKAAHY